MNESTSDTIRVLIVDDSPDIRDAVKAYLTAQGLSVWIAADAVQARTRLSTTPFDACVLDVMMPGEDGLALCRWIAATDGPPVIMLTALGEEADRVSGLEVGADDYVVKPFSPRELLARIRTVVRRSAMAPRNRHIQQGLAYLGSLEIDLQRRELREPGTDPLEISEGEAKLLAILLAQPGVVFSRDELVLRVRGREAQPFERSIDVLISRLRRKIEPEPARPQIIVTQRMGGYALQGEVAWRAR